MAATQRAKLLARNNFIKKFLVLPSIIIIAPFLAGFYGILHDQLTYTISPEYYTKFEFYQFGFIDAGNEAIFPYPRQEVSAVGFIATWWMGIPIGVILGLVGLIHPGWKTMFRITIRAFWITIIVAFLTGLAGLAYGDLFLAHKPKQEFVPDNLTDFKSFIKVASMHTFGYWGGLTGLIAGVVYSVRHRKRPKKNATAI